MQGGEPFGLKLPGGRQPLVAVVIDNAATALVTLALIEQFGCRPMKVPNGEAVLALLKRDPGVDIVIIDLPLGDMDGITVAQLIRALGTDRSVPIIALADDRSDVAGRSRAAGFASTVKKPFSPSELYAALRSALTRTAAKALS